MQDDPLLIRTHKQQTSQQVRTVDRSFPMLVVVVVVRKNGRLIDSWMPSGDDGDQSREGGIARGARSRSCELRVDATDVAGLPAHGSAVRGRPLHGQLRTLRPVPGLPAAVRILRTSRYLHASITFSSQPPQSLRAQSRFSTTWYVIPLKFKVLFSPPPPFLQSRSFFILFAPAT